jgi:ribosomal protein S18 acetylase RimI-like enzyme
MGITYRWAQQEDCQAIFNLIKQLAIFEKEPESVVVSFEHFVEEGFGQIPSWKAMVAADGDKVVGFALFYTRYSTWKGKRLYLEDLYVEPEYRGHKIGKHLVELLQEYADNNGFTGMNWQVLDWNTKAIEFYKQWPDVRFDEGWLNVHWK